MKIVPLSLVLGYLLLFVVSLYGTVLDLKFTPFSRFKVYSISDTFGLNLQYNVEPKLRTADTYAHIYKLNLLSECCFHTPGRKHS